MNSKWVRGQSTRLPWLPMQLTSLCRNTGFPGCKLRPDDLPVLPAVPKSGSLTSRALHPTYLTRKGEIFLYSSANEVQPWQSQVTLEELNILADKRANVSKNKEGTENRRRYLSNPFELVGILKKNIAFPSSWLSPARETVPPIAVKQGMSVSEFLQMNRTQKENGFQEMDGPIAGFCYTPLENENGTDAVLNLQPHWTSTQVQETKTNDRKTSRKITQRHRVSRNRNNPAITLPKIHVNEVGLTKKINKRQVVKVQKDLICELTVPKLEVNSSNSISRESSPMLFSRSSLASETLSILNGQWSELNTERGLDFQCNTFNSCEHPDGDEENADWSYESTRSTSVIESSSNESPHVGRRRSASYSLDSTLVDINLRVNAHNQVNVNAVCPDSTITVAERSNSMNQPTTPSQTTAATTTTYASSRWSRNTPNPNFHVAYSPNRMTPASTPSRRINTHASLLETAKMLLTESSKLEPLCGPILSPRDQTGKELHAEPMVGGGDAGEKVDHEKVRAALERKRQREATELQKQISALDATIERLYSRTREKTIYLNTVVNETFHQIQETMTQRANERKKKQQKKRRVTSELFLRHFRDRQTRKRRIRIKLGLRAAKSGHGFLLPSSLISREVNEEDALKNWETKEDDRDKEENAMAKRFEEQTAAKATSRLRWLREVATTQMRHLEEFIRVTQPSTERARTEERSSKNMSIEELLLELRAKHQRLVSLLQKYGITTEEEIEHTGSGYSLVRERSVAGNLDAPVPATVALRTLWSDLQEEKLIKLKNQALSQFERAMRQETRASSNRSLISSPSTRLRKQWKQDAAYLNYYGRAITRSGFSYFDFWKVKEVPSEDEDEERKKRPVQIPVHTTLSQMRREELARQRIAFNSGSPQRPATRTSRRRHIRRSLHVR